MHRGMRLITYMIHFRRVLLILWIMVIEDENRSLSPSFQKLNDMTGPVRIVHIGDSHVRGHLYPLITRRRLEHDLVLRLFILMLFHIVPVGWHMKRANRVLFMHMIGINGYATSVTFSNDEKVKEIASLHPDLIIVSFWNQ